MVSSNPVACFFLDLDGVIFKHGTMQFNDGALEYLEKIYLQGHQVVFTTARKSSNNNVPNLQLDLTIQRLNAFGVKYESIIGNLSSPRIVINDQGAFSINHRKDLPLSYVKDLKYWRRRKERPNSNKILDVLLSMAWTSMRHGGEQWVDSDEYVQTILVARSLLRADGFDHFDIVKSFKSDPLSKLSNIGPGGLKKNLLADPNVRKGSIWNLLNSGENEYMARDGMLDGAAMRTLPLAAFYGHDLEQLILYVNRVSRITHCFLDARLAAILAALRFRQLLFDKGQDIDELMSDMNVATEVLGARKHSVFFMKRCQLASNIVNSAVDAEDCLVQLITHIGMKHLSWSTPISAVFWSFLANDDYERWLPPRSSRNHASDYATYNGELIIQSKENRPLHLSNEMYSEEMMLEDSDRIKSLLCLKHDGNMGNERAMDVDTFFSMAFGFVAANHGIKSIHSDAKLAASLIFEDDLKQLADRLKEVG